MPEDILKIAALYKLTVNRGGMKALEKKVADLEERLKQVEERLGLRKSDDDEADLMEALYAKAKELAMKQKKAGVIFLQRKLLIDMPRAEKLLKRLEADGVVSMENELGERRVLKEEK